MSAIDNNAVRAVAATLRGPVAEVFRGLLPPLRGLAAGEIYDLAMGNADLLAGCLLIFRKRRDAFAHLLVDAHGRRVNDDFVRLKCGATLHDIIAMITRTHAKRHFRAALGGDPNDPRSPSGRMYEALKEYLIHEWQVPLVPHYAPIPIDKVLSMGPAIMDVRQPARLDEISGVMPGEIAAARAVATHQAVQTAQRTAAKAPPAQVPAQMPARPAPATPQRPAAAPPQRQTAPPPPPPPPPPPVPEPAPRAAAAAPPPPRRPAQPEPFQGTPQEEFWYQTLEDRQVRATLDLRDDGEIRILVAALAHLGEPAHSGFLAPLKLSMPQAAVALTVAYRTMGDTAFTAVFGTPGNPREIDELTRRLTNQNIGSRTDLRALARSMEASVKVKQLARARA